MVQPAYGPLRGGGRSWRVVAGPGGYQVGRGVVPIRVRTDRWRSQGLLMGDSC